MASIPVPPTAGSDVAVVDGPQKPDLIGNPHLARNDFPDDFMFGVGSSAFQVEGASDEGGRGKSIWDTFCEKKAAESNDESWLNHKRGSGQYYQFETDARVMKQLGVKSYRFSISWPRIFPNGIVGKGNEGVNKEGVAFYNNLINALKARGIEPFVTLFHWEVPQALEDKYCGFLNKRIREDFKNYADFCFKEFGDRVKYWSTLNEPYIFTWGGYALGHLAPGRGYPQTKIKTGTDKPSKTPQLAHQNAIGVSNKFLPQIKSLLHGNPCPWVTLPIEVSPATEPSKVVYSGPATEPYQAGHNLLNSHALVVNLYNTKYKPTQGGKIGITLNCDWYEADNAKDLADWEAAQRKLDYMLGWFMTPLTTGVYPKNMTDYLKDRLPSFSEDESNLVKNSFDFVGINYYTSYTVTDAPQLVCPNKPPHFTTDPRAKIYPLGKKSTSDWIYVYAKGIKELLNEIKNKYGDHFEIYITENGIDNKGDDPNTSLIEHLSDDMRIKYHHDHLFYILEAIKWDHVKVKGYFTWSFLDSFEWKNGNDRFGNYFVDYENGLKRYPKNSASWYRFFLNGLDPKRSINADADQLKENGVSVEANPSASKRKSNDSEVEAIEQAAPKRPNNGTVRANNNATLL